MKKTIIFMFCVLTNVFVFSQTMPLKTQPLIWLKADNAGGYNNSWQDWSGNNLHAFTLNQQFKNDTVLFNFNSSFLFDSLSVPFTINYLPGKKENITVLTVYKAFDSQQENGLWFIKLDTAKNVKLTTHRIGNIWSNISYTDTTQTKPIINTLMQSWRNVSIDSSISNIMLCGTDSLSFNGKIAEYIVFNKSISKNDLQKIQSYLAIKYGITLYQADYINSIDSICWDYNLNVLYSNDIAGIGKDTLFKLNQKQSAGNGGDDILTMGATGISATNIQNPSQLHEGDFLIWGNNGKKLSALQNDTNGTATIHNLSEKQWMMQVTGSTAPGIACQLILDASEVDSLGKCVLLINRDATGNFAMNTTEIYYADSIDANKKAYFSGIYWDSDHSGKDMFTFLLGNRLTLLASVHNVSAATANDGVVHIDVLGGQSPYIYSLLSDSIQYLNLWNSSEAVQSIYNLSPGKYLAKVTDIKGSTAMAAVEIFVAPILNDFCFSIPNPQNNNSNLPENMMAENKFEIYPNPCKGNYTISVQMQENIDVTIRIRDMIGKLIEETTTSGNRQYIINGKLKEIGSYLIEIETSKERKIFKLVVE